MPSQKLIKTAVLLYKQTTNSEHNQKLAVKVLFRVECIITGTQRSEKSSQIPKPEITNCISKDLNTVYTCSFKGLHLEQSRCYCCTAGSLGACYCQTQESRTSCPTWCHFWERLCHGSVKGKANENCHINGWSKACTFYAFNVEGEVKMV